MVRFVEWDQTMVMDNQARQLLWKINKRMPIDNK